MSVETSLAAETHLGKGKLHVSEVGTQKPNI
jgi:hypothetical protein